MRVFVTGAKGQLGNDVVKCLKEKGIEFCGVGIEELDLTDLENAAKYIRNYLPDVVVHCAAYTNVDKAESEIERCRVLNVEATATIAKVCKEIAAKLVYISTDYVFSGEDVMPYEIDSEVGPLSVYGQTKLDGEKEVLQVVEKHFIIRTSWAYGVNGENFVNSMLRISKERKIINVVSDQVGSPTFTEDLAILIVEMLQTEKYGIYHATNEGYCSWAEFAVEIFSQVGGETEINFIKSEEYITKAVRPKNSRLSTTILELKGFNRLPKWKDALRRYLLKIGAILD
ncbi:dTDP-4-dehydrorhamnose reductase [Paenibacillus sp. WQ 127069]|uniref:dTDP-4-dehydrorhamnose reductase n=1 Tax=Paenibacillus baimaensis TaxID=2982185 RepID=A0ABT2UAV8_9BACL|nr:dTDP-4-dehydrorhamnose reductase [Paenibacillus sp. WQ 127069]MCU6791778.1 dTDP-4-dehydrorhamnose reductase [Paenibacillus sp. WQ 127069]